MGGTNQPDLTLEQIIGQLGHSADISLHTAETNHSSIRLLYFQSLCEDRQIKTLLRSFYEIDHEEDFHRYLESQPNSSQAINLGEAIQRLLEGTVIIACGGRLFAIDVKRALTTKISEANVESVIQGPQLGLSEDHATNLNLIRGRYRKPTLTVESSVAGTVSRTPISILYDRERADANLIERLKLQLASIDQEIIQAVGELQNLLTNNKRSLFPIYLLTERPDRVAYNLSMGKIVIMMHGTPFVLIMPTVFQDFMTSMDDWNQTYWVGMFLQSLRYIGLLISTVLPSIYVGVTSYNPEIFRIQLALTIAGSRVSVPYPAFLEVLFMLIMMELLTEASIRLPKTIGPTATTVGGLILGEAATQAGLVSNIMVIIVAAVAIANFVIPINAMSFAIRTTKYALLTITVFMGMIGLIIGIIGLLAYLVYQDSCGQPFLKIQYGDKHVPRRNGTV